MRVFAFDPGATSGWFFADTDRGVVAHGRISLADLPAVLLSDTHEPCRRLRSADVAICEDYHIRPHQARQQAVKVPAREGIGIMRAACYVHAQVLHMTAPGSKSAGQLWMEDRLPVLAAHRRTLRSDHERDAIDLVAAALRDITIAERRSR